ncbi:sensor domain-containing diguanylate cyclase [Jeongeupia sp. USM3]|uniref:sensor domain-containing diguanylate cyclase n=1 Tax=Jeongeupia sp. USM3 TaxID=1906741 RepID=UPI00089DDF92|nr:sensor domain-containing diguanylate cyclase [Jeongeupia sp. USM3]AOY00424.1 hypothetical protein BJP62_08220 [Jeongeupia sp. USM3]
MQRIKDKILAKPLELGVVLFLILGVAWMAIAERWSQAIVAAEASRQVDLLMSQKQVELTQVATRFHRRSELLKAVPRILAEQEKVRAVLIDPQSEQFRSKAGRGLDLMVDSLPVDKILVVDREGRKLLSSDFDETMPLQGPVLRGQAFDDALHGRYSMRFGVGALTRHPGFYLSAPVRSGDMILGVVLVKIDLTTAAKEIVDRDLVLVDQNGVIVLSSHPALQLMTYPGATVDRLDRQTRMLLYRQQRFVALTLPRADPALPANVVRLPNDPVPYLLVAGRPGDVRNDLRAYLLVPLTMLTELDARRRVVLWPMLSAGFFGLAMLLVLLIYLVRTRWLRQQLTVANTELRRQAETDALTGIANRRRFDQVLAGELARARRYGEHACAAIIDIDYFKRVNDVHGHPAGDAALVYLADMISLSIRDTDLFARLGGEEFGLLLPQTGIDGAQLLLERLRAAIAAGQFVHDGKAIPLTISIGYAAAHPDEGPESLLQRADTALYAAKQGGRNRVCMAADP